MLFFEVYPRVKVRVTEQEDYVYPENDSGILAFLKLIESLHFEGNLSTWIFWFGLAIISIFWVQILSIYLSNCIYFIIHGTFYFFCEIERISTPNFCFCNILFRAEEENESKSQQSNSKNTKVCPQHIITRRFTPSTKGWILHLMSI